MDQQKHSMTMGRFAGTIAASTIINSSDVPARLRVTRASQREPPGRLPLMGAHARLVCSMYGSRGRDPDRGDAAIRQPQPGRNGKRWFTSAMIPHRFAKAIVAPVAIGMSRAASR